MKLPGLKAAVFLLGGIIWLFPLSLPLDVFLETLR